MSKFSPIPVQPGMDPEMMAQVINQNNQQIAENNRTNLITDENGVNRVIIGRMPDGTYGVIVSKPGVDVNTLFTT